METLGNILLGIATIVIVVIGGGIICSIVVGVYLLSVIARLLLLKRPLTPKEVFNL